MSRNVGDFLGNTICAFIGAVLISAAVLADPVSGRDERFIGMVLGIVIIVIVLLYGRPR